MRTLSFALLLPLSLGLLHCGDDTGIGAGGEGGGSDNDGGGGSVATMMGVGAGLSVDMSFGTDGVVEAPLEFSSDENFAAAWFPDGSVVVGGTNGFLSNVSEGVLVKFDPEGALDTSFGDGGFVIIPFGDVTYATGLAIAEDGSLVVAGWSIHGSGVISYVAKVDANGAFDAGFGEGGVVEFPGGLSGRFAGLVRDDDTGDLTILAGAPESSSELALWRLHENGTLDTSFGEAGACEVGGGDARALVGTSDGGFLVLTAETSGYGTLMRIDSGGERVTSFGESNGYVDLDFEPFSLALRGDDILVGGGEEGGEILALTSSGDIDDTFGDLGIATFPPSSSIGVTHLAVLDAGDIVAFRGLVAVPPNNIVRDVQKVDPTGALLTFETDFRDAVGSDAGIGAVTVIDGGLRVVGYVGEPGASPEGDAHRHFVARLDEDGVLDASYGDGGLAIAGSDATPVVLYGMVQQGTDGIIAMGGQLGRVDLGVFTRFAGGAHDTSFGDGGFSFPQEIGVGLVLDDEGGVVIGAGVGQRVLRVGLDGVLDTTFGPNGNGYVPIEGLTGVGNVWDIDKDSEGRILVMGESAPDSFIARLNPDGTADDTFGTNGVVINAAGSAGMVGASIVTDDALVLAGQLDYERAWIGRTDADGATDSSFGDNGLVVIDSPVRILRLIALADGGFAASGYTAYCRPEEACTIAVIKVTADGTLDPAFGTGGIVEIEASQWGIFAPIAELADGGLLVGGAVYDDILTPFAIWKLTPAGALDTDFGQDGAFRLGQKGRAMDVVRDADGGFLIGGYLMDERRGSQMMLLRMVE